MVRVEEIVKDGPIIKHHFKFEVEHYQSFGKHMTGDLVIKSVGDSARILNNWRFTVEGYMDGEAEYVLEFFKEDFVKYLRVKLTSTVVENIDTLVNI